MTKNLVIIRHGLAKDRDDFKKNGKPDSQRPLTLAGERELKKIVLDYKSFLPEADILLSSPYIRAKQTADIVSQAINNLDVRIENSLKPDVAVATTVKKLLSMPSWRNMIAVGHEPHLSRLLSYILSGHEKNYFELKKGGLAWLELKVEKSILHSVMLKCLLQPKQIKKIGKNYEI